MSKGNGKKISLASFIFILIILLLICTLLILIISGKINAEKIKQLVKKDNTISSQTEEEIKNKVVGKKLCDFDLNFLKEENNGKNVVYSPLSIKASLKMLEEGAEGDSKAQIAKYIDEYKPTNYESNSNMSFANALFVRDTFKVKDSYKTTLESKYNAEVITDNFFDPDVVNSWVSEKTLHLIDELINDIDDYNIILVNALGIDMDWEDKFLTLEDGGSEDCNYEHENAGWFVTQMVSPLKFNKRINVSSLQIAASINNYDIVKEIGEEKIRITVGDAFTKWAKELTEENWEYDYMFNGDLSEENIEAKKEEYLDSYIEQIDDNYHDVSYSTDFSVYTDENVKAFAKDLKSYGGTTLQYVGIMPVKDNLISFIDNTNEEEINNIISNLKDLKTKNFKDGAVTIITGYIPKFKFEYELKLKDDLNNLGITDIFDEKKANLTNISDGKGLYIDSALHKANIEFTQDGIRASAATMMGGKGAGTTFDYVYDVPIEEIDLTFDKPYMFLIRDKKTGEIWFTGSVYEPLLWKNEPEHYDITEDL